MEKLPLMVAVGNQKGGVGKSTLAVSLASYLHYVKGKNVLVVDCDYPQNSVYELRERDKKRVMGNDTLKQRMAEQCERTGTKAYPIISSMPAKGVDTIHSYLKDNSGEAFDIVFADLPGTLKTAGVLSTIVAMDYVITPITPDRMIMQSALDFSTATRNYLEMHKKDGFPLKDILHVWNRIDGRVSTVLLDEFRELTEKLGLTVMDTQLPNSSRFGKELSAVKPFFRSTLFPPSPSLLKGSNIDLLAEELCLKLNL